MSVDPFEEWQRALNEGAGEDVPNEDEQHAQPERTHLLYNETHDDDGKVFIQVFPTAVMRQSAAVVAGQMQALLDTGVFTNDQAFKIVIESMSAVIIHHGDDDDEDD
jgi:hypothetical protein